MERGRPSDRECNRYSTPGAATITLGTISMLPHQWQVKMPAILFVHQRPTESVTPLEKCYYLLQKEQVENSIPNWFFPLGSNKQEEIQWSLYVKYLCFSKPKRRKKFKTKMQLECAWVCTQVGRGVNSFTFTCSALQTDFNLSHLLGRAIHILDLVFKAVFLWMTRCLRKLKTSVHFSYFCLNYMCVLFRLAHRTSELTRESVTVRSSFKQSFAKALKTLQQCWEGAWLTLK